MRAYALPTGSRRAVSAGPAGEGAADRAVGPMRFNVATDTADKVTPARLRARARAREGNSI